MNISGPAAVAKPEMLFYAPGDLTVTLNHHKPTYFKEKFENYVAMFRRFPCKTSLPLL